MLYVDASPVGGRGVFTDEPLATDRLLLTCPVLVVPEADWEPLSRTVVGQYLFDWDEDGATGLVLGEISLVNHSAAPNARVLLDLDECTAELWTVAPVAPKSELTVRYRPDEELWFDPA
jgi:hypothetical protein